MPPKAFISWEPSSKSVDTKITFALLLSASAENSSTISVTSVTSREEPHFGQFPAVGAASPGFQRRVHLSSYPQTLHFVVTLSARRSSESKSVSTELISRLSLIHISEPTRRTPISYAVFCLKKKKTHS